MLLFSTLTQHCFNSGLSSKLSALCEMFFLWLIAGPQPFLLSSTGLWGRFQPFSVHCLHVQSISIQGSHSISDAVVMWGHGGTSEIHCAENNGHEPHPGRHMFIFTQSPSCATNCQNYFLKQMKGGFLLIMREPREDLKLGPAGIIKAQDQNKASLNQSFFQALGSTRQNMHKNVNKRKLQQMHHW